MRAMILAAGRGERMGPLTQHTPKPLLRVGERFLIEYSLQQLAQAGIKDIVINVSYHAEQVKAALGNGHRFNVNITYSHEPERLETGGGIFKTLSFFQQQPFLVLSSDIICDYPLAKLLDNIPQSPQHLAHLVVVDNPSFHPQGDFGLTNSKLNLHAKPTYTFANLGIYHPDLFAQCAEKFSTGKFPLNKLLFPAIEKGLITGEHYQGRWYNIGTPDDLAMMV